MAPAIRNVPASMRSGDDGVLGSAAVARRRAMRMVEVPAPSMRAPIFVEQGGQVGDLGFARGVFQNRLAACQHGGHHEVFGAGDGDAVEVHRGAAQALGRLGFHVAVRLADARAQTARAPATCRLMGRAPMAQPPGIETRARPQRATSGPSTRLDARMVFTSS